MALVEIGLAVIALGWLAQLKYSWKGRRELQRPFVAAYGVGVLLLVADGLASGVSAPVALNALCALAAAAILSKTAKKR